MTFYYLKLGASTAQLGEIQALAFISAFLLAPFYGHVLDTYGSYFPLEEEEVTAYLLDLIGGATKSIPAGQHGETTPFISVVVHALAIPSLGHGSVHNFIASKQAGPSPAEFAFINMSSR